MQALRAGRYGNAPGAPMKKARSPCYGAGLSEFREQLSRCTGIGLIFFLAIECGKVG